MQVSYTRDAARVLLLRIAYTGLLPHYGKVAQICPLKLRVI
jgi:hypothetical protein